MITRISLLTSIFCVVFWQVHGKPTNIVVSGVANILPSSALNPIEDVIKDTANAGATRQQRSPQFGLLNDYDDYSDENEDYEYSRNFKGGHKHKPHKIPHKPLHFNGGYGEYNNGCRGYDCGGSHPQNGHYGENHGGHQGGSFATASAGSIGGGDGPHGGGHSEANSQSASFSFGPYTASFSVAQAISGRQKF